MPLRFSFLFFFLLNKKMVLKRERTGLVSVFILAILIRFGEFASSDNCTLSAAKWLQRK